MPSPQEIREKTFEKAVFGGYDMAQVDNFLAELSDEMQSSQKEITVLKSKMKVLVDKIEEYRENEDAMRMALISAQKISTQIQNEAEQKCSEMLESAQIKSQETIDGVKDAVKIQEKLLADTKLKSAEFIEHLRALSKRHLEFLDVMAASEPDLAMLTGAGSKSDMEQKFAPVWEEEFVVEPTAQTQAPAIPELNRDIADASRRLESAASDVDDSPTRGFAPVTAAPAQTAPKISKPRLNFDDLRFGGK